jgi:hypothetical protein
MTMTVVSIVHLIHRKCWPKIQTSNLQTQIYLELQNSEKNKGDDYETMSAAGLGLGAE